MKTLKASHIWAIVIVGFILILTFTLLGVDTIDAGNKGIKVNMIGSDQGVSKIEYVTGYCFYFRPTQRVYEFPLFQQTFVSKDKDGNEIDYDMMANGGIMFKVSPQYSYSVTEGNVAEMFTKFRKPINELETGYMKTTMLLCIRDVVNKFSVDSLLNNRAALDAAIQSKLSVALSPYFTISQFTTNLKPDPRLSDAIVAKAQAKQEEEKQRSQLGAERAKSEVTLLNARVDSAAQVISATAEANSIKVKQEALKSSPNYIELIRAERWDGKYPQVITGGSTMLNIPLK